MAGGPQERASVYFSHFFRNKHFAPQKNFSTLSWLHSQSKSSRL
jgi:hypothetical protein